MTRDLLEHFRGQSAQGSVHPGPTKTPYEAFRAAGARQPRLKLQPVGRAWERVSYGYLYRIVEDGWFGTQIGLIYNFAVIVIRGRNLQRMADAIDRETCEVVQQFDTARWDVPNDARASFVEEIEFHVETRVEASDTLLASIAAEGRQRR